MLTEKNLPYHQIIGSYNNKASRFSYMVLKPEMMPVKKFRKTIFKLGQKFNQESVILSSVGEVQFIFIAGKNAGRAYLSQGFETIANRNCSVIKCICANNMNICDIKEQCLVIGEYRFDKSCLSNIFEEFEDLLN